MMDKYYGQVGMGEMQILNPDDYQIALLGVGILLFLLIGGKAMSDW